MRTIEEIDRDFEMWKKAFGEQVDASLMTLILEALLNILAELKCHRYQEK